MVKTKAERFLAGAEKQARKARRKFWRKQRISIRKAIKDSIEVTEQRDAAVFDALQGTPPAWMPSADVPKWREARRFFLGRHPELVVWAWIKGQTGPDVPPMPDGDLYAEHLTRLQAVAYRHEKEKQRARAENNREKGFEDRLKAFAPKYWVWEDGSKTLPIKRSSMSSSAAARQFARNPSLYVGGILKPLAEDTLADYIGEVRKRGR